MAAVAPKRLEDFLPETRQAIEVRKLEGEWRIGALLKLLKELTEFDQANTEAARKAMKTGMICLGVGLASILVSFFIPVVGVPMMVGFLGAMIFFLVKRSKLKKADLVDDFRISVQPLLRDLAHDIDTGKKIEVRMDFSGAADGKKSGSREVPQTRYMKLTETVFPDPWCVLTMPLIDGSVVTLEMETTWKKLERKYRGRSGKTKYKTKWRKECMAAATVMPGVPGGAGEPALRARLHDRLEKLKMLEKSGVTGARMERYWVFKNAGDPPIAAPPAEEIVGMVLRLHAALTAGAAR